MRAHRVSLGVLLLLGVLALPVQALTPLPPTPTPTLSATVCADGCAFASLAAALDAGADELLLTEASYDAVELRIERRVVIRGTGADGATLQAGATAESAAGRLFVIAPTGELYLHNVTLQHGQPSDAAREGGLLYNEGSVSAYDTVFRDGLANNGGALLNRGSARLVRCWFDGNRADGCAPFVDQCGSGGAIKSEDGSTLSALNVTFSNNQAHAKGGAIHVSCHASAWLSNATLVGNEAKDEGGGLSVRGEAHLEHCTVARNRAAGGGGVYVRGVLTSVAGLYADNAAGGDLVAGGPGGYKGRGEVVLEGPNLVGDGGLEGALRGPAMLGELADVGGWIPCLPLEPGSAALDRVPPGQSVLQTDARGARRFTSYLGSAPKGQALGDLGAFELQPEGDGLGQRLARRLRHWWGRITAIRDQRSSR